MWICSELLANGRIDRVQIIISRPIPVYADFVESSEECRGSLVEVSKIGLGSLKLTDAFAISLVVWMPGRIPCQRLFVASADSLFDVLDHFANTFDNGFNLHHVAGDIGVVGFGADRVGFAEQLLREEIEFATVCFV